MYCTKINLYGSRSYPLALGAIYERIAAQYELPEIRLLLESLKKDISWPDRTKSKFQVYYLEDMIDEQSEKALFEVRFATARDSRELTLLFLSIGQSQVDTITIQFPGRSGRGAASNIIGYIKSVCHDLHINHKELDLEIQGFREKLEANYIKEHSISAFIWIEGIGRYLHVRENPFEIPDVIRGFRKL